MDKYYEDLIERTHEVMREEHAGHYLYRDPDCPLCVDECEEHNYVYGCARCAIMQEEMMRRFEAIEKRVEASLDF